MCEIKTVFGIILDMLREKLPLGEEVLRITDGLFDRYRKHVETLDIEARGNVLIVGPGMFLEEVAVIEPEIVKGNIDSMTLIRVSSPFLQAMYELCEPLRDYPIEVPVASFSYGHYFDRNPLAKFDTILRIGKPGLEYEELQSMVGKLNPSGKLYMTVNALPPDEPFVVEGCDIDVIPDIVSNPNYDYSPGYFGIVVTKSGL